MTHSSALCRLMFFALMGQIPQQQPPSQTVHLKGRVVAFHRKWRFPTARPAFGSMALPADLWIVRIDSDVSHPRYVLAKYEIYTTPLSDADIKKELFLEGSLQPPTDSENPCQQLLAAVDTKPKRDFVMLESRDHNVLSELGRMSCLVVAKPPIVAEGGV